MKEIWKPVPGWKNFYSASNLGRVRSHPRISTYIDHRDGGVTKQHWGGKILKPAVGGHGYKVVTLSRNGKKESRNVHELVMLAFRGIRPRRFETCHNDGRRTNNRLRNLRYDTQQSNCLDRLKHKKG